MKRIATICMTLLVGLIASVAASAQSLEEVQTTRDGLTLNANIALADGQSLDGNPAVLLLHGTLAHKDMELIGALQTALAERGINSVAPSLSFNESDRRGMYNCDQTMTARHDDAFAELSFWKDWMLGEGVSEIVLMGHSRGGNQIAQFAVEHAFPEMKKVALLAPATWKEEAAAAGFQETHGQPLAPLLEKAKGMAPDELLPGVGAVYCTGVDVTAGAFLSYYTPDQRRHTPYLIPKITVPVLVIAGSKDTVVKGLIPAVEAIDDGDKVQLTVIEDADHFFLDFFAEDAADAVETFVAE